MNNTICELIIKAKDDELFDYLKDFEIKKEYKDKFKEHITSETGLLIDDKYFEKYIKISIKRYKKVIGSNSENYSYLNMSIDTKYFCILEYIKEELEKIANYGRIATEINNIKVYSVLLNVKMMIGLDGEEGERVSKGFGCGNYSSGNLLAMIFSQCNMGIDYKDTDLKIKHNKVKWKANARNHKKYNYKLSRK